MVHAAARRRGIAAVDRSPVQVERAAVLIDAAAVGRDIGRGVSLFGVPEAAAADRKRVLIDIQSAALALGSAQTVAEEFAVSQRGLRAAARRDVQAAAVVHGTAVGEARIRHGELRVGEISAAAARQGFAAEENAVFHRLAAAAGVAHRAAVAGGRAIIKCIVLSGVRVALAAENIGLAGEHPAERQTLRL